MHYIVNEAEFDEHGTRILRDVKLISFGPAIGTPEDGVWPIVEVAPRDDDEG